MNQKKYSDHKLRLLIELAQGDDAFIREMMGIFLRNTPLSLSDINSSLESSDFFALGNHAHKLKSSVQIVGDESLHLLIKQLENQAKNQANKEELNETVRQLNSEMNVLLSFMKIRLADQTPFSFPLQS